MFPRICIDKIDPCDSSSDESTRDDVSEEWSKTADYDQVYWDKFAVKLDVKPIIYQ